MCAHKVVGMSVIALMCSAVIANTSVMIGPGTKIISASVGGALPADCAPRIVHDHMLPPSSTQAKMHDLIVGNWVGETAIEDGRSRRFLAQHFKDGKFSVTTVTREPDGHELMDVHTGRWGIAGSIYFTSVTPNVMAGDVEASGSGIVGRYNAYEVLNINDEIFEYQSFLSREQYETRRVAEGFQLEDL